MNNVCKNCFRLFNRDFVLKKICKIHTKPDFTINNYNIQKGNFKSLEERHIQYFKELLGDNRTVTDLSDLEKFNVDWLKHLRGQSRIALKPTTTEEVSKILSFCNSQHLAVVPQGGNTGLVGGSVPVFDEIIVTTELMNKVINIEESSGVLVCQAGCVLENLNNQLSKYDLMMPLDLGAKGSCHIGGNVSTNAGGLRLLRYGNLHGNILGLEVVKANGDVIDLLSTLKKDNTGYHMQHLFIGSEGTLGFVTKVAIQCAVKPSSVNLAFLGVQSFDKVLKTFRKARREIGEVLSAFEMIDTESMRVINKYLKMESPIGDYPFYLIIETSGSNEEHDTEKLNSFLETALLEHYVLNGTVASDSRKKNEIWSMRERLADCMLLDGYVFCYDFTLPHYKYYKLVDDVKNYMGNKAHRVFAFGHLGDGNLHLQISVEKYTEEIKNYIEPRIFEMVTDYNGSISAEHGIGFLKRDYLNMVKNKAAINMMRIFKNSLDPNSILNPYKII